MADTNMQGIQTAIVATSTSDSVVTCDPKRIYLIQHNGVDVSGSAVLDGIAVTYTRSVSATPSATGSAAASTNKYLIIAGGPQVPIGPGVQKFALKSLANAPTVSIYATAEQQKGW